MKGSCLIKWENINIFRLMKKDLHLLRLLMAKSYFVAICLAVSIVVLADVLFSIFVFHSEMDFISAIVAGMILGIFNKKFLAFKFRKELKGLESEG